MLLELNASLNRNTENYLPPAEVFPIFAFPGASTAITQNGILTQNFRVDNIRQSSLQLLPNNTQTINLFESLGVDPDTLAFVIVDFRAVAPEPVNPQSVFYTTNVTYPIPLRFQVQYGTGGPVGQTSYLSLANTVGTFPFDELILSNLVVPNNEQGQLSILIGYRNT